VLPAIQYWGGTKQQNSATGYTVLGGHQTTKQCYRQYITGGGHKTTKLSYRLISTGGAQNNKTVLPAVQYWGGTKQQNTPTGYTVLGVTKQQNTPTGYTVLGGTKQQNSPTACTSKLHYMSRMCAPIFSKYSRGVMVAYRDASFFRFSLRSVRARVRLVELWPVPDAPLASDDSCCLTAAQQSF